MTISSTTRVAGPFTGNGTASVFPFAFKAFQASDLRVVRLNTTTLIETTLVLNSDYTVTLNGNQNTNPGGSITLTGGPLATGQNLVVTTAIGNLQPTDLTNQGGFYPEVINDSLDRATIQIQQLQEGLDRSIKVPITQPVSIDQLVADLVTVAADITNVDTVATNIVNVNAVGTNIADVTTVAADLNEPVSEIETVAASIANVDAVGPSIASVNAVAPAIADVSAVALAISDVSAVAAAIADVSTVAADITDVSTAATNIASIIAAPSAASAAAASEIAALAAQTAAESARDAALVSAGVYATIAAGLAATSSGDFFRVIGSGSVAFREYEHKISPNLFDASTVRDGYYVVSSTGNINSAAGWGCSDFIPVTPGLQYTLSGSRSRVGLCFYTSAADNAGILASYNGTSTLPLTVTAPAGATHCAFNLYTATSGPVYSNIQFEEGAVATTYYAYNTSYGDLVAELPSAAAVTAAENDIDALELATSGLPVNYLRNYLRNGNIADTTPSWNVESAADLVLTDVSAVSELSSLGIRNAYSIPTAGGVDSRIRLFNDAVQLGIITGEHLLVGLFFYASDGSSFPTSFASFAYYPNGSIAGFSSNGFVQVSTNVRFMWAKVVAAGPVSQMVLGFNSGGIAASAATRYISGFFVHRSSADATVPSAADVAKLTGWNGEGDQADAFASIQVAAQSVPSRLVLAGDGAAESYIEVVRDGSTIRRTMTLWPIQTISATGVINPRKDIVNGLTIKSASDDPAPYRALGTTIGANHGYAMYSVAMNAHGKTTADIGSVYSNSGNEYVIVGINGVNAVWMTRRADNGVVPVATFTHVSGGTNTANIVATASTYNQMYPPFSNRVVRVMVDGVEVYTHEGEFQYTDSVQFIETYDVYSKSDIVEWFVSTGGPGPTPSPTQTPAFSVSICYAFDFEGQCTIYTDFVARKAIALTDIMFVMSQRMATGVDGTVLYYIPKTLPVTHEGTTYNYANKASSDTSAWSNRLNITPSDCVATGILADRVVQLTNNYGFALGYLPVQSTSIADRRNNATVKALQISDASAKVYMSAIDKGGLTLAAGDYFSTIAYRNIVLRSAARTSQYAVRTNGADYFYVDWHAATTDRVPIPADFVGRDFVVVEKSSNVTMLSQALASTILVSVSSSASYGYLILKIL